MPPSYPGPVSAVPVPRRRDDPRMQTVEMAALPAGADDAEPPKPCPSRAPLSTRRTALLVAAGGAGGALVRYLLELAVPSTITPTLVEVPWATWTVNVLGCLALGMLTGWTEVRPRAPRWCAPLLGTGACGGFTTMSTLVLQVSAMLGTGFPLTALEYGMGSVVVSLAAAVVGLWTGHLIGRRRAA